MTPVRPLALIAALATVLAGACATSKHPAASGPPGGEASRSPSQIVSDAKQATGAATSVRLTGNIVTGGTTIQLDVVADHGHGGGSVVVNGLSFDTVLNGTDVYLKADAATWTKAANASVATLLANKWIKTSTANKDFSEMPGLLDISQLVGSFTLSGTLTKGAVTTFDGIRSVPVTDHESDGGTMYVAASGTPYIVAMVGAGANRGTIRFSQYGTAQLPPVPSGALDLNQLEGQNG